MAPEQMLALGELGRRLARLDNEFVAWCKEQELADVFMPCIARAEVSFEDGGIAGTFICEDQGIYTWQAARNEKAGL